MLCGRAPFHSSGRDGTASAVMQRIKTGDFDFSGEAWKHVSSKAKAVIQGDARNLTSLFPSTRPIPFIFTYHMRMVHFAESF